MLTAIDNCPNIPTTSLHLYPMSVEDLYSGWNNNKGKKGDDHVKEKKGESP